MISARFTGLPDLKAALAGFAPKLRVRALRNALAAGARVVQKAARAGAPVISPGAVAVRKGYRKPGTVQKAISVRTSKLARRAGDVGVFVNVRPAKRAQRGGKSPNDPFYWLWLEFGRATTSKGRRAVGKRGRVRVLRSGSGAIRPIKFLQNAAGKLGEALQVFTKTIGLQIAKLNKPKAPAP
jgi:hypothetical protein